MVENMEEWRKRMAEGREKGLWPDNYSRPSRYQNFRSALAEELEPGSPFRVLDVGSSYGVALNLLLRDLGEYRDVDFEPVCLDPDKQVLGYAEFLYSFDTVQGVSWSMPFEEESIDILVSKYSVSKLDSDDRHQSMREIERVMSPGAFAALQMKSIEDLPRNLSGEYLLTQEDMNYLRENSDDFTRTPYSEGLGEEWLSDRRLFRPHWKL